MKYKNERNDRHPRSYPYAIYAGDLASRDLDTNLILPISPPHDRWKNFRVLMYRKFENYLSREFLKLVTW